MTDEEFLSRFEDATLAPEQFHHADHVRMAFLYLQRYPALLALELFSESLQRFATALGKPDRYHETITWAFLLLIRERMARADAPPDWPAFAAQNADLLAWPDHPLKRYYRDETLAGAIARGTFVLPDRAIEPTSSFPAPPPLPSPPSPSPDRPDSSF